MKTLTLLAIALVALAGLVGCTAIEAHNASAMTGVVLSPQDEAAVRGTIAELDTTWNSHDMKGLHDLFTEDAYWVRTSGNVWRDKRSIHTNYEFDATTPSLSTENIEVRSLAPHVAVAVAIMKYGKVVLPSGQDTPEVHNRVSFVMAKRGEAWKIVHLQESTLLPIVEENDAVWGKTGLGSETK
jgi:uncharacterized protein (TIGR02246 family)